MKKIHLLLLLLFTSEGKGQDSFPSYIQKIEKNDVRIIEDNFYIEARIYNPSLTLSYGKIIKFNQVDTLLYLDGIYINPIGTYYESILKKNLIRVNDSSLKEFASICLKIMRNTDQQDPCFERKFNFEIYYKAYLKFEYVFAGYEIREIPYLFQKNQVPNHKYDYLRRRKVPIYLLTKVSVFKPHSSSF